MKLNSIKNLKKIKGQRVLVRVDFNVPLKDGEITDDYRLQAALPTLEFLLSQGARVILLAHLGDPAGEIVPELSLKPIVARLSELLKRPVIFVKETVGYRADEAVASLKDGEVLLLENLRFNKGEYQDDSKFAKKLAAYGDVYINEAFSVSHRQQASVSALRRLLPNYQGLQLVGEIEALDKILEPTQPLVVVMGGAKITTKLPLIKKLRASARKVLIGGALANNFFKFSGLEVGQSLVDEDQLSELEVFFKKGEVAADIILPIDVVVKNEKGQAQVLAVEKVSPTDTILDIGPETIRIFGEYIKEAQTIVWNGPMGYFEERAYSAGTLNIAMAIAARSTGHAFGLVGGGETVAALGQTKMSEYVDFISTGGGAMLSYLGGEKMPGLD
ncbi:MAG: phosphoglycerate kinase [Candidatus Parcubacteria bacterium]|jgi:phosphoglycerate kinase|nr:MAG: hypothetical protein JST_4700 [Candidatus Parcubacteria bacterium]